MNRKTLIYTGLGGLTLLALLAWAFAPRPLPVDTAVAGTGRFELAVVEDGRTRLRQRHVLSAPLAGRLQRITLREGDAVSAGMPVAVLLPLPAPMIDARSRAELAARAQGAEAALQRSAALLGQSQVALAQAQTAARRSEQLAQAQFIAPTQLDNDRLAVQAAQKGLEAATQARHMAEHELAQARAALAVQGTPGGSTAPFVIRAPVDGRVLKVAQTSEATVAAGTPLLELGDLRQLEIVAELLTPEALQVPPQAAVQIERWGGSGLLEGRVRRVEPGGFTKVSALGVEEQRVNVVIDLSSPPERWAALGDGFRVGVRILRLAQEGALRVPVSAVFPLPAPAAGAAAGMGVFKLDAGQARLQPVQLGGRNSEWAWVTQGLKAGDTVIVYPGAQVADGVRVKPRKG